MSSSLLPAVRSRASSPTTITNNTCTETTAAAAAAAEQDDAEDHEINNSTNQHHHPHNQIRESTTTTTTTAATATACLMPDFIGSSSAVKDLFGLPYTVNRPISVAVHNVQGTLLIDDADPGLLSDENNTAAAAGRIPPPATSSTNNKRSLPKQEEEKVEEEEGDDDTNEQQHEKITQSLVALSTLESSISSSEALTLVNAVIEQTNKQVLLDKEQQQQSSIDYDASAKAAPSSSSIPPSPEPREYLSWRFHDMNLLVGSDALIYRSSSKSSSGSSSPSPETALTVRVEDAVSLQRQLAHHETALRTGAFVPDHQLNTWQQVGKPSYAEAAAAAATLSSSITTKSSTTLLKDTATAEDDDMKTTRSADDEKKQRSSSSSSSFAAPDWDQVELKTCTVPVSSPNETTSGVGNLLNHHAYQSSSATAAAASVVRADGDTTNTNKDDSNMSSVSSSSPVSTVLDSYLDNIMANVPQLALCLREKGFIQSVKLLNTSEIPSRFLHSSTLDTSTPFEIIHGGSTDDDDPAQEIFSPKIMEMNASALLRFLKTNCSKDNATYLLRREAGHTNIQLYDISSISTQRQQKWIWWLAMISYRFSSRLRHLSLHLDDQRAENKALRRSYRARQRSLLHNTLELLDLLADLNGNQHESLIAAVRENLADTFLTGNEEEEIAEQTEFQATKAASPIAPPPPLMAVSSQQPYANITVDALNKAQDHLALGIKALNSVLKEDVKQAEKKQSARRKKKLQTVVTTTRENTSDSSSSDSETEDDDEIAPIMVPPNQQIDPVATQLFGLYHKLTNVSLRLAEIHLKNYWSSSAMQNLRTAAFRISDSLYLSQLVDQGTDDLHGWLPQLKLQYTWLWEECGHFARSFAADVLWRERGHASGDDVVSVLQDVESAFAQRKDLDRDDLPSFRCFFRRNDPLSINSRGLVALDSLSGIVNFHPSPSKSVKLKGDTTTDECWERSINAARSLLSDQKTIQRDERKVLVAASLAYSRAIYTFDDFLLQQKCPFDKSLIELLRQRLGDACNETGKVMLNELRSLLVSLPATNEAEEESRALGARALVSSAEFWFLEGLHSFEFCRDLRNLALLRCNLCQCCKLRANALLAKTESKNADGPTHAEVCLQDAANHLHSAHEVLETRDVDPITWDMVSSELAATYLVLGVRRRQSLIGSGNNLMILHALRLSPGKEKSIVDPMERALKIYEQMGNHNQAAAAHYQLALFFSKIWTCQRDEAKTREKLAAGFDHFHAAYAFFSQNIGGNEITFCLLCLDVASLYSAVSGEEGLSKALLCCLDTAAAFTPEVVDASLNDLAKRNQWFEQMDTIATSVEERVFSLLKSLVKLEDGSDAKKKYKDLYRAGLTAKMSAAATQIRPTVGDEMLDKIAGKLLTLNRILRAIKTQYDQDQTVQG